MTHHAVDFGIGKLLRHDGTGFGICGVILTHQFKVRFLATNHNVLRVGIIHRQACTTFVVFAQVRLRSGEGCCRANLDGDAVVRAADGG